MKKFILVVALCLLPMISAFGYGRESVDLGCCQSSYVSILKPIELGKGDIVSFFYDNGKSKNSEWQLLQNRCISHAQTCPNNNTYGGLINPKVIQRIYKHVSSGEIKIKQSDWRFTDRAYGVMALTTLIAACLYKTIA